MPILPSIAGIALIVVLVVVRRVILGRWVRYRLGHRTAAALYSAVLSPVVFVALIAKGVDGFGDLLFDLGLALVLFLPAFLFTELMLRYFGGEMDPPGSPTYERRGRMVRELQLPTPEGKLDGVSKSAPSDR